MGILLSSFMGGMCLGSFLLPFVVPARFHPLRVYAVLELAIGAIGGTLPWWLPWLSDWYLRNADESLTGISVRAAVAAVAILPPTMLMGATLPAVARWVKSTPEGLAELGVFYGANTIGAVLGCLAAGFVLLPNTDAIFTSHVAAAINAWSRMAAFALAFATPYKPAADNRRRRTRATAAIAPAMVCCVIALSGFTALGAEVVWTRLLSLLFGSTVYTFAIILAVFLAGLGIGSTVAARWVNAIEPPAALARARAAGDRLPGPVCEFHHHPRRAIIGSGRQSLKRRTFTRFSCTTRYAQRSRCCPRRCSGARAFRSRWLPPGAGRRTPADWSAKSMPRTRSERSSARLSPVPY